MIRVDLPEGRTGTIYEIYDDRGLEGALACLEKLVRWHNLGVAEYIPKWAQAEWRDMIETAEKVLDAK